MGHLRDDFTTLVAAGERADLARAALAIARIGHPALDPAPWVARLDDLAAGAHRHVRAATVPSEAAARLCAHLFGTCGFRGNSEEYYDPRNSFLNDVLERRTGIPISLAVVLIETGARLDLRLEGVGFPGHFLVRVPGAPSPLLLDPFHGGRALGERELLERYRAAGARTARAVPPEALEVAGVPAILARMLRNLLRVYVDRKDHAHALDAVDLLLVLEPESAEDFRLRGLLHERLACYGAAAADLRHYLTLAPAAPDADRVRKRVARLESGAQTLH